MTNVAVAGPKTVAGAAAAPPRFVLLLLAGLAVAMSYGVSLPVLPRLLAGLGLESSAQVARHTGWLTAAYTLSLVACSPLWGTLSDRLDRRWVMGAGLAGSALALAALESAGSLPALYVARVVAGALAAAVLPTVLAYVLETSPVGQRQRRFAWVSSATAVGFLLGPAAAYVAAAVNRSWSGPQQVALVCGAAACLVFRLPRGHAPSRTAPFGARPLPASRARIFQSLMLTGAVVYGITVAEVGLTLLTARVAPYFALCSVVMIATQLWGAPLLERRIGERRLLGLAFLAMSFGVALLATRAAWAPGPSFLFAAAGLGVLVPALAVRISVAAGERQGWAMGRQAAAANLGQALGAATTGMLFAEAYASPFLLAAAVLGCGGWFATRRAGSMFGSARRVPPF